MTDQLPYLIIFVGFGIAVWWSFARGNDLLNQWASRHGFTIVHREYKVFDSDALFQSCSGDQNLYRVTIVDRRGMTKIGWVRCALLGGNIEVKWER
ncbi:MAG: hypothetical protein IT324_18215 [Anaerolineae bacterium]|nr:hypothetical protein [Anaerolineae bacterium]